jgi:hypothetical protein
MLAADQQLLLEVLFQVLELRGSVEGRTSAARQNAARVA